MMGAFLLRSNMKLKYNGSIGWLIFWALVFLPVALILAIYNTEVIINKHLAR